MDTTKIMDDITKEIGVALKSMSQTKDASDKEVYSRIVKNLCEALDVFLAVNRDIMPYDFDEFDDIDNGDLPF
ncbi:MAG: hypothetical protein GX846_02180 [Deltaproteobacteria bacterium]|jgi:DNA-binding Xre family transcriptional regulator|nr:hypothetical protein [Deltaproteobacteria bacterium]